ncbi:MAG: hypothetical protein HPY90_14600 [Syntrophothermus sp.]|uniref:hypothetical protein n=1 Tax=Syntrophothermus sp. TaxID=2736299 RepID=UPI00258032A6|nr:hypothetical protein [Syntrophothermus sp.]NSW84462.1 hypothetical protein [Syntrophothermus sp.]
MISYEETLIRINNRGEIWIESEYNGTRTSKQITIKQLCDLFAEMAGEAEAVKAVVSPALPRGCVGYAERTDGVVTVAIEYNEPHADVVYYNTKYENVPQPRMVFFYKVYQERIRESYVACVSRKELFINNDTPLYRYPYSNVSGSFQICFGANALPKIKDLSQLAGLPYFFVSCPMNDDWYEGANRSGLVLRELLEITQGKEFDENILVDASITFKQLFEKIGGV